MLQADVERGLLHDLGADAYYVSMADAFTTDSRHLLLMILAKEASFTLRVVPCQDGPSWEDAALLAHEAFRGEESFVCLPGCIVVSMPGGLCIFDVRGRLLRTLVHEVPPAADLSVLLVCSIPHHRLAVLPLGNSLAAEWGWQPGCEIPAGLIVYDTLSWQLLFSQMVRIPGRPELSGCLHSGVVCLSGRALASAALQGIGFSHSVVLLTAQLGSSQQPVASGLVGLHQPPAVSPCGRWLAYAQTMNQKTALFVQHAAGGPAGLGARADLTAALRQTGAAGAQAMIVTWGPDWRLHIGYLATAAQQSRVCIVQFCRATQLLLP